MTGKTILWGFGVLGGIVVMFVLGGWAFYRWQFPYGYSHSCYKILEMAEWLKVRL